MDETFQVINRLEFGPRGTPPILFLHGFPGIRSRQNRDIAEKVSSLVGRRAIVLMYEGLGQVKGEFSFQRCLEEVEREFLAISSLANTPIDLVGHSWGGFQAIRLAGLYGDRVNRLVLMSPLLRFFPLDVCEKSFADTQRDFPEVNLGDISTRAKEFVTIGGSYPYKDQLAKIPAHVETTILQASDDQITPGVVSKDASHFVRGPYVFEIRETDHSFLLDRVGTAERIAVALKTT